MRTYKRISSADSEAVLGKIYTEIADRYGRIPESVDNLFEYAKLRKSAEQMHIVSVDKTPDGIAVKLDEKAKVSPEKLMEFLSANEGSNFSPNGIPCVKINAKNIIEEARLILRLISEKE